MKAAMLREWQTVNQAGLSPHDVHCHQYLAISRYLTDPRFSGLSLARSRHCSSAAMAVFENGTKTGCGVFCVIRLVASAVSRRGAFFPRP
jgi:hypothetical protein